MHREQIVWKTDYEVGVEDIDLQHHYFIGLINRFAEALAEEDQRYQVALLSELNAYARFHFISEETMMLHVGYPFLDEHRHFHIELIDQLNSREGMMRISHSAEEASKIVDFLLQWFQGHSTKEDMKFAEFIHKKKEENR